MSLQSKEKRRVFMFQIIEARLKTATTATEEWHKYLEGKKLLLCTSIDGNWNLCAIEGDTKLTEFCKLV